MVLCCPPRDTRTGAGVALRSELLPLCRSVGLPLVLPGAGQSWGGRAPSRVSVGLAKFLVTQPTLPPTVRSSDPRQGPEWAGEAGGSQSIDFGVNV